MIVEFSDRVGWILLGMALGYILRLLQEMKKEVDEVDEILTKRERRKQKKRDFSQRPRNEEGSLRVHGRTIAIAVAILLCLYATFSTGATNNKLENTVSQLKIQADAIEAGQEADKQTQLRLARITVCTQDYLSKTIEALNQRTEFSQAQADANVSLQKAQSAFLRVVLTRPPVSQAEVESALQLYVSNLQAFVEVASKNRNNTKSTAYPTREQLVTCLSTPTLDEKANPDESSDKK